MKDHEVPEFVNACEAIMDRLRRIREAIECRHGRVLVDDLVDQVKDTMAEAMMRSQVAVLIVLGGSAYALFDACADALMEVI